MGKNIVLIATTNMSPNGVNDKIQELGIASIAAYLRSNGHNVLLIEKQEKMIDYEKIQSFHPNLVGYTTYSDWKDAIFTSIDKVKECCPNTKIYIGGFLATYHDIDMMQENINIDFATRGEGEITVLELVENLNNSSYSNILGLTYRMGNEIIRNDDRGLIANLDMLPPPSRDSLKENKLSSALISTSRGCRGNCSFCCSHKFWAENSKSKIRFRNIKSVVDEIENITNEYGVRIFKIIDASFFDTDTNRMLEFASTILDRNLNIAYSIDCRAEVHQFINKKDLLKLKESGLVNVFVGIEAANEEDLHLYSKIATVSDNYAISELLQEAGISSNFGFINFNPYSTIEKLRKNLDFLEHYGCLPKFSHMNNLLLNWNSRVYKKIESDGLLIRNNYDNPSYRFVNKTVEQLFNFITWFYQENKELLEYRNMLQTMAFYMETPIQALLKLTKQDENMAVYNAFYSIFVEFQKILSECNQIQAQFINSLLDLAEEGWDKKRAYEIGTAIIDSEHRKKFKNTVYILLMNHYRTLKDLDFDFEW